MKILTINEVSERTRIPVATLRFYRHLGDKGPKSFLLAGRIAYKEDDVESWIEEQYTKATS